MVRRTLAVLIIAASIAAPSRAAFGYSATLKDQNGNQQVLSISGLSNVQFTTGSGNTLACDGGGTILHVLQGAGFSGSNAPDPFNATYTITLEIDDYDFVTPGILTFTGKITGSFSNTRSSLVNTWTDAYTKSVTLGVNTYSVTMLEFFPPGPPVTAEKSDFLAYITCSPTATAVSSVALSPAPGKAGRSLNGTVTLNNPAPRGGASVALSSTAPAVVGVPSSVTVAEGATSATFIASAPNAGTGAQVKAQWNGTTATQTLSVAASICADIDGNGTVDMKDAVHLIRGIAGLEPLPNC
ncbi:MAG TPA: hypothetical protein VGM51_10860 [Armatimonadota bacterium]